MNTNSAFTTTTFYLLVLRALPRKALNTHKNFYTR
nr:MAG TPA: hypothetical protein [Caudoviricetes sp.]DAN60062.1 MAG TPA: hypothetical protein [Caudoviricetes sp.]